MFEILRPLSLPIAFAVALFGFRTNANIGVGTTGSPAGLEVATLGSASMIIVPRDNTANRPVPPSNGMIRYNTTANAFEGYANGAWMQFAQQPVGSTTNVSASGPPVSANVYTPSTTTCNYSPAYGSCAQVTNGSWPANGSSYTACTNLPPGGNTIVLDYGSGKTIGNIYFSAYGDGGYLYLGVSFSNDNVTYTSSLSMAAPYNGGGAQYASTTLAPNQVARYVRLTNGAGNTYQNGNFLCQFATGP